MAFDPKDCTGFSVDDDGDLTAVSVTAALVATPRTNAADAACVVAASDGLLLISSAGGGAVTITHAMAAGQIVTIVMTAFSTGVYTMAVAASGTLTFNAANEMATIQYDGTAVRVLSQLGATIA